MTDLDEMIKSQLESKTSKEDFLAEVAELWDKISELPRLHPEGDFPATFIQWGEVRASERSGFCYLAMKLQTEEGTVYSNFIGSYGTLFFLKRCEIPSDIVVRIKHVKTTFDGEIYARASILGENHDPA